MKVLITGAGGQLGSELQACAPANIDIVAFASASDLDVTSQSAVDAVIAESLPDVIINAAAYTAVDKAEGNREQAMAVNADAPANLARACVRQNARLIHISTDFVFDGQQGRPYKPDDAARPLGVYGETKLAGELAITEILGDKATIIRTAWVYSSFGNNFVKTMLRLMNERDALGVVADQVGTPSYAADLAADLWRWLDKGAGYGIHHWTNAGVISWYDFAMAIYEEGRHLGLITNTVHIKPITTADYPTPAARPPYSVLDKSSTWEYLGQPARHWRQALRDMLLELTRENGGSHE